MGAAIIVTQEHFIVFRDDDPLSITSDRRKYSFFARHSERLQPDAKLCANHDLAKHTNSGGPSAATRSRLRHLKNPSMT